MFHQCVTCGKESPGKKLATKLPDVGWHALQHNGNFLRAACSRGCATAAGFGSVTAPLEVLEVFAPDQMPEGAKALEREVANIVLPLTCSTCGAKAFDWSIVHRKEGISIGLRCKKCTTQYAVQ